MTRLRVARGMSWGAHGGSCVTRSQWSPFVKLGQAPKAQTKREVLGGSTDERSVTFYWKLFVS